MRIFMEPIPADGRDTGGKWTLHHSLHHRHYPTKKMLSLECTLVTIDQRCQRAVLHYGVMKTEKEALAVRCPTCGAKPREKCELNNGLPRTEPHPARRPSAEQE